MPSFFLYNFNPRTIYIVYNEVLNREKGLIMKIMNVIKTIDKAQKDIASVAIPVASTTLAYGAGLMATGVAATMFANPIAKTAVHVVGGLGSAGIALVVGDAVQDRCNDKF